MQYLPPPLMFQSQCKLLAMVRITCTITVPILKVVLPPIKSTESSMSNILKPLAVKLKQQLEALKIFEGNRKSSTDYKMGLLQEAVQDFIENSSRSGASRKTIEADLRDLYSRDLLVSSELYQWALGEVESSVPTTNVAANIPASTDETECSVTPLFCKDTLYHASLCCYAVSTRDAATYQGFFSKDYPTHLLEEISLSRSDREDVDRYLIARQGSTYYVAFQSEPQLSKWPELFTSFQEGKFPFLYFLTPYFTVLLTCRYQYPEQENSTALLRATAE